MAFQYLMGADKSEEEQFFHDQRVKGQMEMV